MDVQKEISLRNAISYCIENNDANTATNKIMEFIRDEKEALSIGGVSNCNGVKDPNIVKTYALISRKDGLTDVWCDGECLGKGLDADGINNLNLQ
jgi:hypothetical protein